MKRLLSAVAGVASWAVAQSPLPETIGPYLQNPAPDAMSICYLKRSTGTVVMTLGEDRPLQVRHDAIPGTPWTICKARATGLMPGKTYPYRVQDRAFALTTPDPAAAEMRAIFLNDLHNRSDTLAALMTRVQPADFEMSFLLGDCWGDPSPANGASNVFCTLDAYVRLLNAGRKPMLFVRGNHETRGGFADRMAMLFDIPGLDPAAKSDDQVWRFALRTGPLRFVAMDTGEDDDYGTPENSYKRPTFWRGYRERATPWLKHALSPAQANGAPWTVFLSHIPLYNPAGWECGYARTCWEPILKESRADLMLAGHDHGWKLVPAGQPVRGATPPCPVLIGGGPSLKEGTAMLLDATAARLRVRLLNAEGKELCGFEEKR